MCAIKLCKVKVFPRDKESNFDFRVILRKNIRDAAFLTYKVSYRTNT